jgi:hypothetical protein
VSTAPSLLVQSFLRAGGTFEALLADHGVKAKPHNGKVSFVYDQLAAKNSDPLACQCRGLVLREGTWDVVAYPFSRFFNHGQVEAAAIDWATARFEDKLDGTLIIAYWDDVPGRWMCATRSMCEAHGDINGAGTFAELADRAARAEGVGAASMHDLFEGVALDRGCTFMFELTGPYNTIVCQYDDLKLTLLGARRLATFEELDPTRDDVNMGLSTVRTWHFDNIDHLVEVIRDWDPKHFEGVIVKDAAFNRIKVKSPKYLAVAHATDSLGSSWRSVCEAVLSGAADDIGDMLPPLIRERVDVVKVAVTAAVAQAETDLLAMPVTDDMKAFAAEATKSLWPAALFSVKRGKAGSVAEFARGCSPESVLDVCEKVSPGFTRGGQ